MAGILPVFMLALVVEARAALPIRSKRRRHKDKRARGWVRKAEAAFYVLYALAFLAAMVILIAGFVTCLFVLGWGITSSGGSSVDYVSRVVVFAIVGVVLTALLPTSRLVAEVVYDRVAPAFFG